MTRYRIVDLNDGSDIAIVDDIVTAYHIVTRAVRREGAGIARSWALQEWADPDPLHVGAAEWQDLIGELCAGPALVYRALRERELGG